MNRVDFQQCIMTFNYYFRNFTDKQQVYDVQNVSKFKNKIKMNYADIRKHIIINCMLRKRERELERTERTILRYT